MKTSVVQILSFFDHYETKDIQAAIKAWATQQLVNKAGVHKLMKEQGWYVVGGKPKGKEYVEVLGEIWVQEVEKRKELEKEEKIRRIKQSIVNRNIVCPKCGRMKLRITEVNTGSRNLVGGDWKSLWFCPDWKGCGFEEYSKKTVKEEVKSLEGGRKWH